MSSAHRIVDSGVSVLIQGATGSGKEAFAHGMHFASRRAGQAFVWTVRAQPAVPGLGYSLTLGAYVP